MEEIEENSFKYVLSNSKKAWILALGKLKGVPQPVMEYELTLSQPPRDPHLSHPGLFTAFPLLLYDNK